MLKTITGKYLLSPILDHKEKYELGDIEIKIVKNFENNLRRRNCQLGVVESIPDENPLNISLGDVVFVNHFIFHGDIGDGKSFTLKPHVEYNGKMLFKVDPVDIYFKYNNKIIDPVGDNIILEEMTGQDISMSLYSPQKPYKDRGRVLIASCGYEVGQTIFVETNALYPLELNDKKYFKVKSEEVVGTLDGTELMPSKNRLLLEDHKDDFTHSFLDLSLVKRPNTIKANVIRVGDMKKFDNEYHYNPNKISPGDIVLRFRNYGIKYNNQVIVSLEDDNIHAIL